MDLYLSNCLKAAAAAASNAASEKLKNNKETCKTKIPKPAIPKIGPSSLLDLPLGAKLPIIPGSTNIFYTTNISEKLYQPSFGFNLSDPYCKLMETTYKSLHDPHLKSYFKRKDILKKLKQDGFITNNNKVICSLKELNKYREYLTTLKIDFERNYVREQKMIESQINKLNEERRAFDDTAAAEFQQWLLQEGKKAIPHEDRLLKLRHLRMINKELDKIEDTLGRRNTLQLKEEERQHWENVRRKLNQHKHVEEEWQSKEMALLTKIGEEVKKESKVEERRRKMREEIKRKKQIMLEKRIAYHLQKLLKEDTKEEKLIASVPENQTQPETASSTAPQKPSHTEENTPQEHQERKPSTESITSIPDEGLLEESRESKYTSQTTKATFDEEKSSFYELLEAKFTQTDTRRSSLPIGTRSSSLPSGAGRSSLPTGAGRSSLPTGAGRSNLPTGTRRSSLPTGTRRSSLPAGTRRSNLSEEQTFREFLEPTDYHHSGLKKTSFAEQTLFQEPAEQKYGPVTAKRASFINQKFVEDLLEAKYLYPNVTQTSFTDQRLTEDNPDPKLTPSNIKKTSVSDQKVFYEPVTLKTLPNIKKTSFDEDEAFQELMEAITPPQHKKKTYSEHRLPQGSMESKRSSQYSQSNMKVFIKTSAASLPQERDELNTTEQKTIQNNQRTSTMSHHSLDRGVRKVSIPQSTQAREVSGQSLHNVPKQETDTHFQNTHQQNK